MDTATFDAKRRIRADDRPPWPWLVGIGAGLVLLGMTALANLALATFAALYAIATMLLVGGLLMMMQGLGSSGGRSLGWLLLGVIYIVAAGFMLFEAGLSIRLLTLWMAALLVVSGGMRVIMAATRKTAGWEWLAASGFFGIMAGVLIGAGWPSDALWALGLLLGIDLFIQGTALLALGFALRSLQQTR